MQVIEQIELCSKGCKVKVEGRVVCGVESTDITIKMYANNCYHLNADIANDKDLRMHMYNTPGLE